MHSFSQLESLSSSQLASIGQKSVSWASVMKGKLKSIPVFDMVLEERSNVCKFICQTLIFKIMHIRIMQTKHDFKPDKASRNILMVVGCLGQPCLMSKRFKLSNGVSEYQFSVATNVLKDQKIGVRVASECISGVDIWNNINVRESVLKFTISEYNMKYSF